MNIDTGEIRDVKDLTAEEKSSGKWIEIPKKYLRRYIPKSGSAPANLDALNSAEAKRERKRAIRAMWAEAFKQGNQSAR